MKYITVIVILFFTSSCATKFSTVEMRNNFSKEEIKDLKKITDFFKSEICQEKDSDFNTCFSQMLPQLVEYGWLPILESVDFEKQKDLYANISQSTFDAIWEFGKATYPETGLEFKDLGPKYNGRYVNYLLELGRQNDQLYNYADGLISAGDFESMGSLQRNIFSDPEKFNLKDPNIQLLIAVHYLSQNDQQKRTEKWETE